MIRQKSSKIVVRLIDLIAEVPLWRSATLCTVSSAGGTADRVVYGRSAVVSAVPSEHSCGIRPAHGLHRGAASSEN